jgi:hypothetical protein
LHPIHEYHDTLKNIYLGDFKQSDHFEQYCRESGKTDISFSIFKRGALMCRCIQQPAMRVCVDEIETGFSELVFLLKNILRRNKTLRKDCCAFCRQEEENKEELGEGITKFCDALITCVTASMIHCFTASLLHCFTASLLHCFTASLLHCFTASLI